MKTIGIIGGMSPESTVLYYQTINRETNRRLGGNRSADIVMHSVDFETIAAMQRKGAWDEAGKALAQSAQKLESIGAEALVLATNTMHKVAPFIEAAVRVPLIHIVDATADAVKKRGFGKVGLLGTKFTMSDGFYTARMAEAGVETPVPSENVQNEIHRIIFEELCLNKISAASKTYYYQTIEDLKKQGAEGVILGCTEIGLLVDAADCPLPVFDSAEIHALAAVDFALNDGAV
ncbi:aspartate/glutamate racemase family protein [Neisseria chenwenguii]|uniref:Aspartate/glutamate racemase n=1 Tax=Neisseria chenwenguii TaxID=1853278 RepID=A0A220S317_9NEIS|nr:aspartate/glutamate racemase family protein [Neisseria chenwenguii]ASK27870.1 aspartate/glutamate racemase [Neisseria chenwenguii]ROV56275.1 aspartate/glutamate racemase family protein [Neisseria chenwenguii]